MSDLGIFIAGCFTGCVVSLMAMALMQTSGQAGDRIKNWDRRKTVAYKSRIEE